MGNLNAVIVKKALECCTGDDDCKNCPYWVDVDVNCFDNLKSDALALITSLEQRIKLLEGDNEYLRTQITATEARAESRKESDLAELLELRLKVEELTEENERLAKIHSLAVAEREANVKGFTDTLATIRADTVRKMQELIYERLDISVEGYSSEEIKSDVRDMVYQIAKEMLESNDG